MHIAPFNPRSTLTVKEIETYCHELLKRFGESELQIRQFFGKRIVPLLMRDYPKWTRSQWRSGAQDIRNYYRKHFQLKARNRPWLDEYGFHRSKDRNEKHQIKMLRNDMGRRENCWCDEMKSQQIFPDHLSHAELHESIYWSERNALNIHESGVIFTHKKLA